MNSQWVERGEQQAPWPDAWASLMQMFGVIADSMGKRVFSSLDLLGAFYSDDVNDGMMGNVRARHSSPLSFFAALQPTRPPARPPFPPTWSRTCSLLVPPAFFSWMRSNVALRCTGHLCRTRLLPSNPSRPCGCRLLLHMCNKHHERPTTSKARYSPWFTRFASHAHCFALWMSLPLPFLHGSNMPIGHTHGFFRVCL